MYSGYLHERLQAVKTHSYYSFCDNGKIEELRWDKKYALTFIRDKQVAEEIEKIKKDDKITPMHHPHDGLFKTMLRTPEVAIDFLKARLDPYVLESLDLATFKLENSSFIDERLKATHSDLVFSLKQKDQKV